MLATFSSYQSPASADKRWITCTISDTPIKKCGDQLKWVIFLMFCINSVWQVDLFGLNIGRMNFYFLSNTGIWNVGTIAGRWLNMTAKKRAEFLHFSAANQALIYYKNSGLLAFLVPAFFLISRLSKFCTNWQSFKRNDRSSPGPACFPNGLSKLLVIVKVFYPKFQCETRWDGIIRS